MCVAEDNIRAAACSAGTGVAQARTLPGPGVTATSWLPDNSSLSVKTDVPGCFFFSKQCAFSFLRMVI